MRNRYDTPAVSAQARCYHTTEGEISRYQWPLDTGNRCYEAVEACRVLVSRHWAPSAGPPGWCSPAGADHGGLGGGVRQLSGRAAVQVYRRDARPGSWCRTDRSRRSPLQARSYEETAESRLEAARLQAMAAMEAAGLEGRELLLGYQDSGGGTVTAGWIAR